jgi:hypothetical protein
VNQSFYQKFEMPGAGEAEYQSDWDQNENGSHEVLAVVLRGKEETREQSDNSQDARVLVGDTLGLDCLLDMAVGKKDYDKLDGFQGSDVLNMPLW